MSINDVGYLALACAPVGLVWLEKNVPDRWLWPEDEPPLNPIEAQFQQMCYEDGEYASRRKFIRSVP